VTSRISLGIEELSINFMGNLSSQNSCRSVTWSGLWFSANRQVEIWNVNFAGNSSIKSRFLVELLF